MERTRNFSEIRRELENWGSDFALFLSHFSETHEAHGFTFSSPCGAGFLLKMGGSSKIGENGIRNWGKWEGVRKFWGGNEILGG